MIEHEEVRASNDERHVDSSGIMKQVTNVQFTGLDTG